MKHKIGILMVTITLLLIAFTAFAAADNETINESNDTASYVYELPSNPNCTGLTGDLNRDGIIDELDFEVIKNMISGQETPSMCGDLDGDGYVSPGDFSKLKITVVIDIPRNNITFEPSASLLANTECNVFGDINGDGKADYQDVGIVKKMVIGQYPVSKCADLDGDTIVSPGDISLSKMIAAGMQIGCIVTHNCTITNDTNQTGNSTNETGDDDDQGDDNDNQGNQTNSTDNNQTNSTGDSNGNSTNSTGNQTSNNSTNNNQTNTSNNKHRNSGSSSRGGTAVFRVYTQTEVNETEVTMPSNSTVVETSVTMPENATEDNNETAVETAIVAENTMSSYKPSIWMIGVIIALVVASLGITGVYISDTFRKKKAYA